MNYELLTQLAGYIISGFVALYVAGKQHSKTTALIEYRLSQLESKMDKHNNFVERLGVVETKVELINKGNSNG